MVYIVYIITTKDNFMRLAIVSILSSLYPRLVKPLLFLFDPEDMHNIFIKLGRIFGKTKPTRWIIRLLLRYDNPKLKQTIAGITFNNPVGLSAGFDKNADLINIIEDVGFGFTQVGTITNEAYEGNPKPRLFRLPRSKGIVVYFGLKNIGAKKILQRVKRQVSSITTSISIGKTNSQTTCTTETGIADYYACLKQVIKSTQSDFYTINISCPNTFGGEPFTIPDTLNALLKKLFTLDIRKPVFLKMPINLPWEEFTLLVDVAISHGITGLIIGNLNKNHRDESIQDNIPSNVQGGISGKPTWELSNALISNTYKHYNKQIVIIGVGGIFSAEDAYEKIKLGASLVQLITGMIFQGPQLVGEINRGLIQLLQQDGYQSIQEAIGAHHAPVTKT